MNRFLRQRLAPLAVLVVWALALPALAAKPDFPALSGRVVDQANMLSPATEADLTGKLEALETKTGRQLVVVTLPTLQGLEIEDYGYRLGRSWGIGDEKADNGVLLIVAPNQRAVRIEVGYGMEPFLTDALTSVILQTAVLPKFREGQMEAGVVAGTEALIEQMTLPVAEARSVARQAEAAPARDEGGGFPFFLLPVIFFVIIILLSRLGGRRRRKSGLMGALPWILLSAASSGRGGGWSGGGGSGWSGGGGFSGGGGSFGGGGSTGRW